MTSAGAREALAAVLADVLQAPLLAVGVGGGNVAGLASLVGKNAGCWQQAFRHQVRRRLRHRQQAGHLARDAARRRFLLLGLGSLAFLQADGRFGLQPGLLGRVKRIALYSQSIASPVLLFLMWPAG